MSSALATSKAMINYQKAANLSLAQQSQNWQERMSNSAHQREIADLKKAGLNPVLSVTGGNGASTPSGATASVGDASGYFSSILNYEAAKLNSATQLYMHETPSGNTLIGQVEYVANALGLNVDDVLDALGVSLTGGENTGLSNSDGSAAKVNARTQKGYEAIENAMSGLIIDKQTASLKGRVRKSERLGRKLDRLAYLYPEQYKNVTGKYPAVRRDEDWFGKKWRNRRSK